MGAILHTRFSGSKLPEPYGFKPKKRLSERASRTVLVIDARPRTACSHGLGPSELRWPGEGMGYLKRQGAGSFVTVEAYAKTEREARALFRKVKSDIALRQRRAGARRVLWLEILEGEPAVHSHIVAAFHSQAEVEGTADSLNRSSVYGETVFAEPVSDWAGLTGYLAGEATPQAWFAAGKSFPRVAGSHRLGEGGGDRVRLSPDLEAALLRAGRVEPRKRTYAARALPKPPLAIAPTEYPAAEITGQLRPAPVIEASPLPASQPISATAQFGSMTKCGAAQATFTGIQSPAFGAPHTLSCSRAILSGRGRAERPCEGSRL
jgi:hypothetical protein